MLRASWSRIAVLGTLEEGFSLRVWLFVLEAEEDELGRRLAQVRIQVDFAVIIRLAGRLQLPSEENGQVVVVTQAELGLLFLVEEQPCALLLAFTPAFKLVSLLVFPLVSRLAFRAASRLLPREWTSPSHPKTTP